MKQEFEDQSGRLTRQHDKALENLHVQLDNQRTDFRKQEKQLREDLAIAKNGRENAINEKYGLQHAKAQRDETEERLTLDKKRLEKQLEAAADELAYARRQLEQIDNINDTLKAMKNMVKPLPGNKKIRETKTGKTCGP